MRPGTDWDPETEEAIAEWRQRQRRFSRYLVWLTPAVVGSSVAQGDYLGLAAWSILAPFGIWALNVAIPRRLRRDPAFRERMLRRWNEQATGVKPVKRARPHRLVDWILLVLAVILLLLGILLVLSAPHVHLQVSLPNPAAPPLPDTMAIQVFVDAAILLLLYGARGIWRERFLAGIAIFLAADALVSAVELTLGWTPNPSGALLQTAVLPGALAAVFLGIRILVLRWKDKRSKPTPASRDPF